jgi:hypothetical protein
MFQDLISLNFIESQMLSNALCEVMSWKLMLGLRNHNKEGGKNKIKIVSPIECDLVACHPIQCYKAQISFEGHYFVIVIIWVQG